MDIWITTFYWIPEVPFYLGFSTKPRDLGRTGAVAAAQVGSSQWVLASWLACKSVCRVLMCPAWLSQAAHESIDNLKHLCLIVVLPLRAHWAEEPVQRRAFSGPHQNGLSAAGEQAFPLQAMWYLEEHKFHWEELLSSSPGQVKASAASCRPCDAS